MANPQNPSRQTLMAQAETTLMRAAAFAATMASPEGRRALAQLSKPEQVAACVEQAERIRHALDLLERAGLD